MKPDHRRADPNTVIRTAGAYVAWVMGSGFATGQEILQFFTSYGHYSFILLAVNLIGFLLIGPEIMRQGRLHAEDPHYDHFHFFCGKKLGTIYSWFLPFSLFAGMVILISGSGATLEEYYGLNHYVGALIMAALALAAYIIGFRRFVRIIALIGPAIIAFTLIVATITIARDSAGLQTMHGSAAKQPVPFWWLSGLLYISYNLCGGSKFYSALGTTTATPREAVYGGVVGTLALMASILLMNTAMLTDIDNTSVMEVPTLFLARKISFALGALFSVILIMGIFSSCSAMLWTISERFVVQGSRGSYLFAAGVCIAAFFLGLLPFSGLIGVVYTVLGYVGLVFGGCVVYRVFAGKRSRLDL